MSGQPKSKRTVAASPLSRGMEKAAMTFEATKATLSTLGTNVQKQIKPEQWAFLKRNWPLILAAFTLGYLASIPQVRWNTVLFFYMPLLSGLHMKMPFLQPLWDAYVEFELRNSKQLLDIQWQVREIQAEDYSWKEFNRVTENRRYPVVIRGLFKGTKALETYGTDEWAEKYGDFTLQEINDTKKSFKYEYDLVERGTFTEYIRDIKAGNYRYSYGLDEIYTRYPQLVEELEYSRYDHFDGTDYTFCRSVAIFVSSGGPGLRWHNADSGNLGMMIRGSKTFDIIDPMYSPLLGPAGNKDPYATGFSADSSPKVFEKIPSYSVTLKPGDAFFLPVWYWHRVMSYGDDENLNMFNTCRFGDIKAALLNAPMLELYRHTGFVNWLHPAMPTLVRWIPFFRVLQDGFREMFTGMPRWDSEDCFSSKREACDRYFKSIGWDIVKSHF